MAMPGNQPCSKVGVERKDFRISIKKKSWLVMHENIGEKKVRFSELQAVCSVTKPFKILGGELKVTLTLRQPTRKKQVEQIPFEVPIIDKWPEAYDPLNNKKHEVEEVK